MKITQPYALNEIGQRQNQEDTIFPAKGQADSNARFFLVCDGMGGHENGELASRTVCESFTTFLKDVPPSDFDEAVFNQTLAFAYDELDKKDKSPALGGKMGTTLTFLHSNEKEVFLAHIGDSRIYHLRAENGETKILFKTSDHSLVNELLRAEVITEEEAENHPKKNVITRAMQPHLEKRNKADIYKTADVKAGDYFFMCSDGVLESLCDDKLIEILSGNTDDKTKIKDIYQLCNMQSKDNFSAYLIFVAEGISETAETVELVEDESEEEPTDITATITAPPRERTSPKVKAPRVRVKASNRKKTKSSLILLIILFAICVLGAYYYTKLKSVDEKSNIEQSIKNETPRKSENSNKTKEEEPKEEKTEGLKAPEDLENTEDKESNLGIEKQDEN